MNHGVGKSALSLVEAVIGVLVASLLVTSVIGFFVHVRKTEHHGSQALDSLASAQLAMAYLRRDVQGLADGAAVVFADVDDDERRELVLTVHDDIDADAGRAETVQVVYEVDEKKRHLIRTVKGRPKETKILCMGCLDLFHAQPLWSYWIEGRRGREYRDGVRAAPPRTCKADRFFLHLKLRLVQVSKAGQPVTPLEIELDLFPRELNQTFRKHWIGGVQD